MLGSLGEGKEYVVSSLYSVNLELKSQFEVISTDEKHWLSLMLANPEDFRLH